MNPLVQDMLLAQHREDLELRNLEGLLEDECKCEANHVILPCTGKIVGLHISECTGNQYLKCLNAVKFSEDAMKRRSKCRDEPAVDCWTIRPV